MPHQLGERVVRDRFILLELEFPGRLDVLPLQLGGEEQQRREDLDLAVGRLVPLQHPEGQVQGRHALLGHRGLGVQRQAAQPRLELPVGQFREQVVVAEAERFQAAADLDPLVEGLLLRFRLEERGIVPGDRFRTTHVIRVAHQLVLQRERHRPALGEEATPHPFRRGMDQLDRAGPAELEADQAIPLGGVEELASPLLDAGGDIYRHGVALEWLVHLPGV